MSCAATRAAVPADQAAGLRRRASERSAHGVHCIVRSSATLFQFVDALHRTGLVSLLVDMQGRLFGDAPTRSLFDWRQQFERDQLHTLPQPYGDAWHAPGIDRGAVSLDRAALGYDCVVFDAGWSDGLIPLSRATHTVVMELEDSQDAILQAYSRIKAWVHAEPQVAVGLMGGQAACDHVRAACARFLGQAVERNIFSVLAGSGAFSALAIRIAGEETGLRTR